MGGRRRSAPFVQVTLCLTSSVSKLQPETLYCYELLLFVGCQHLSNLLVELIQLFVSSFVFPGEAVVER